MWAWKEVVSVVSVRFGGVNYVSLRVLKVVPSGLVPVEQKPLCSTGAGLLGNALAASPHWNTLSPRIWEKLKALFGAESKEPAVFHEEWIALLQQNVPLYARLPEELQLWLHERIGHRYFLQETTEAIR